MERINSKEWIKSLKIALINEDLKKIEEYSNREVPSFNSIEEAKKALNLVEKAENILKIKKNELQIQMKQIKQTDKYRQNMNFSSNEWKV